MLPRFPGAKWSQLRIIYLAIRVNYIIDLIIGIIQAKYFSFSQIIAANKQNTHEELFSCTLFSAQHTFLANPFADTSIA